MLPYFRPYDIHVEVTELQFGDACFAGNGPNSPITIGVERKVTNDLVSSMRSNRLSGFQLPGLLQAYDLVFLVVEGIYRCGHDGALEVYRQTGWTSLLSGPRPVLYREVSNYLLSLEMKHGVKVMRTSSPQETTAWIVGTYKWFDKPWEKHGGPESIYSPILSQQANEGGGHRGRLSVKKAGPVALVAADIPGIDSRAWEFEKQFKTVEEFVLADQKRLAKVEGIGKKLAERIHGWFRGNL